MVTWLTASSSKNNTALSLLNSSLSLCLLTKSNFLTSILAPFGNLQGKALINPELIMTNHSFIYASIHLRYFCVAYWRAAHVLHAVPVQFELLLYVEGNSI